MHSPLDLPTVQALGDYSTHPCLQASANAWLAAYNWHISLAFTEAVALRQAGTAWDRAAEPWRRPVGDEPVYESTEVGPRASQAVAPQPPPGTRSMPDAVWLLVTNLDRLTEAVYTFAAVQLALHEHLSPDQVHFEWRSSGTKRGTPWPPGDHPAIATAPWMFHGEQHRARATPASAPTRFRLLSALARTTRRVEASSRRGRDVRTARL